MKFFIDGTKELVFSSDELEQALLRKEDDANEFSLVDEENNIALSAEKIFLTDSDYRFLISYNKGGGDRDFFAKLEGNDCNNIKQVIKCFVSFYENNNDWKNFCEWDEASGRQTFFNFIWMVFGVLLIVFLFWILLR